ncbi:MAG: phytoene desaturase [Verrucomicrobia bacterium]|nr:phytoene desaturase [Verrucomicrobiota bacterium]
MKQVGIIGGGLGGLASACVLAARGYEVTVFERSEWLGGKAAVIQSDGFRFDMGPTILTLPRVLERIFAEAGRQVGGALELVRLDPQWRSFFEDGSTLDLVADLDAMASRLAAFTHRSETPEGFRRFMKLSERLHRISDDYFFWRPVGGLQDMFDRRSALKPNILRDLLAMRPGCSMGGTVRAHIPDRRVAQMVDHFAQYVGSAPDASPSVLCSIGHMQTGEGIWYPMGGTRAVPVALVELAKSLGVTFRCNSHLQRILISRDEVQGVQLEDGEMVRFDAVVSNSDSVRTHRELIGGPPAQAFERRRRYEPACSGVVLYLGLKHRYNHLLHHNFVFSRDPEEEFHAIYSKGEPAPDPTCYVCAPSGTEPAVAPTGGEALYVLVHTPYLRPGQDWSRMLPEYRRTILEKLKRTAGLEDIETRIIFEQALTPADIDRRYHVLNGAIYGLASHGRFLGAFKPGNRSPDVRGLYLAGGAAHPGPGMPMVLMSGWIAADALDQDAGRPHGAGRGGDLEREIVL